MSLACSSFLPGVLCAHADVLLYLAPSMALAFLIWMVASAHPAFFVFTVAGTLFHELAHFSVGLLTFAEPTGLTVIPRRTGRTWELGSVTFANLRWYNAAPAALAPFLVLAVPFVVAAWRTEPGWHFAPLDLALALLLAPQFLSFWPSDVDWRLAARSWPWLVIIAAGGLFFFVRPQLFQIVKARSALLKPGLSSAFKIGQVDAIGTGYPVEFARNAGIPGVAAVMAEPATRLKTRRTDV